MAENHDSFSQLIRKVRKQNKVIERLDDLRQLSRNTLREKHYSRLLVVIKKALEENPDILDLPSGKRVKRLVELIEPQVVQWAETQVDWKKVLEFLKEWLPVIISLLLALI